MLVTSQTTARCIFCGQPGASAEHVFGRWISRLLGDSAPFTLTKTPGRSSSGLKTINVISRAACTRCNGSWMSRSEREVKPLLRAAIGGNQVEWNERQQLTVARWAFKTALMLDRSSPASRLIPAEHFRYLHDNQQPLPTGAIYLSRYFPEPGDPPLGVVASAFRPHDVDPLLYPQPYHLTFSVGQAVFEVFGHSGQAHLEVRRAGYRSSGLVVPVVDVFRQLWPIQQPNFNWPPAGGHLGNHNLQALARF